MHLFKDLTRLSAKMATGLGAVALTLALSGQAMAQTVIDGLPVRGAPHPEGIALQPASTSLADEAHWIDHMVLIIIGIITAFVCALLLWVILRYNRRANQTPARFTHNSPLEVAWTILPIFILIFIGSFTVPALFRQQIMPQADVTIKITGYQWYWGYEYQTDNELSFDSLLLQDGDRASYAKEDLATYPRLLAVDNEFVVPVGKTVRLLVTAADVLHSFAMPAFGVKMDAVPGRLNETWFKAEAEGLYYGQCSELCGKDHAFMPIAIRVVSQDKFDAWLAAAAEDIDTANRNLMAAIDADAKSVDVAANSKN